MARRSGLSRPTIHQGVRERPICQIQLDPRYAPFIARAADREVLGLRLRVAAIEDILQGKIWAVQDPERRASKRQKDLADIARVLEWYPHLRSIVPADILARLMS